MCCRNLLKTVFTFVVVFSIGTVFSLIFQRDSFNVESISEQSSTITKDLSGINSNKNYLQEYIENYQNNRFIMIDEDKSFSCLDCKSLDSFPSFSSETNKPLNLISKSRTLYTDLARKNKIEGVVILQVEFLANGKIGKMSAIKGLPNGLTEQFLGTAREIKFEPAMKNGIPQTVTKSVQYNFTIY